MTWSLVVLHFFLLAITQGHSPREVDTWYGEVDEMTAQEIANASVEELRTWLLQTQDDQEQVLIEAELDRREWPGDEPEDMDDEAYDEWEDRQ